MAPPCYFLFRLLCVDEDTLFRENLQKDLEGYGFEMVTAEPGIDGLMQYKAHGGEFGAIILSSDGPRGSGADFALTIREMGYDGRMVVMSVNLEKEEFLQFAPLGISGFLRKPFDPSLLAAMLLKEESDADPISG